jgi:hypothetical protein
VIAKTEVAMSHLAKQFEAKTSGVCGACVGKIVAESGTIEVVARHVKTVCKWLFC